MKKERLFSAMEVCVLLDCSIYSLNNWYTFKRENPDSEYSKMLPEFVTKDDGARRKRYWKQEDVPRLIEFKANIPHGRNGILGSVTQKYVKKKQEVKVNHGKKKHRSKKGNS